MRVKRKETKLKCSGDFSLEGIRTIWVQSTSLTLSFSHTIGSKLEIREYQAGEDETLTLEKRGDALLVFLADSEEGSKDKLVVKSGDCVVFRNNCRAEIHMPIKFHGQIYAETKNGDVEFEGAWELENLQVKTEAGDVLLGRAKAQHFLIETKEGDISAKELVGDRQCYSDDGDIDLKAGSGYLKAQTYNGDMAIIGEMEGGLLKSVNGDIDAVLSVKCGNTQIENGNGDVEVRFTKDSSFVLDVSTINGDVDNYVNDAKKSEQSKKQFCLCPGNLKEDGTNLPHVTVSTVNGDIGLFS